MERISSGKNPKIQLIRSLYHAKGRAEHAAFLAEGEHLTKEANQHCEILFIAVEESCAEKYSHLLAGHAVVLVESRLFKSISETVSPQGICAVCRIQERRQTHTHLLLLNGVQDPGNVGTMIRTADAAGFDVILDKGCADIYNPKTIRSSMGSLFHIACRKTEALAEEIQSRKEEGYRVYAAALGGSAFFERGEDAKKLAIVIGNEGKGIDPDIQSICTDIFELPMPGQAESLNAGVAAAIMMYDVIRQAKEK